MHRLTTLTVLFSISMITGCAALKTPMTWFGDTEEEMEYGKPSKIVAIWTNSVFNEPGKSPVRGLGGRIYFYDSEHHPVAVNGKLAVFLYDDTDSKDQVKQEATKVIHFTSEQVAKNYSPSEFGASYSFWVPWGKVGGERTQLSIIPVFTGTDGLMLVGDQARHLLPGTVPDEASKRTEIAQATNYTEIGSKENVVQTSGSRPEDLLDIAVSTIKLPPAMQRRVSMSPPKRDSIYGSMTPSERQQMIERFDELRRSALKATTESAETDGAKAGEKTTMNSETTKTKEPLTTRSRLGLHRARTWPFSQQSSGLAPTIRDPEASLFAQ